MSTVRVIKTKEEIQQLGLLFLLKEHFENLYGGEFSQSHNLENNKDVFWLFDRNIPIYTRHGRSVLRLLQDIGLMDNSDKVNDDVKMLDLIMANDPYVTSGQITNEEMEELKVLKERDLYAHITLLGYLIATGNLLDIKQILKFASNPDVNVGCYKDPQSNTSFVDFHVNRIQGDDLIPYNFRLPTGEVDIIDDLLVSLYMDWVKFRKFKYATKLKYGTGEEYVSCISQERTIKLLDHPLDIIKYTDSVHVRETVKLFY